MLTAERTNYALLCPTDIASRGPIPRGKRARAQLSELTDRVGLFSPGSNQQGIHPKPKEQMRTAFRWMGLCAGVTSFFPMAALAQDWWFEAGPVVRGNMQVKVSG